MKGKHTSALSELIRKVRAEKGHTLITAGQELGVSDATVSYWEHGTTRPNYDHMEVVSSYCGIEETETFRLLRTPPADDLRSANERIPGYVNRLTFALRDCIHTVRVSAAHGSPVPLAFPV